MNRTVENIHENIEENIDENIDENICQQCVNLNVILLKETKRVKTLKNRRSHLYKMLQKERQTIKKMQKEINKLKAENEKFNLVIYLYNNVDECVYILAKIVEMKIKIIAKNSDQLKINI